MSFGGPHGTRPQQLTWHRVPMPTPMPGCRCILLFDNRRPLDHLSALPVAGDLTRCHHASVLLCPPYKWGL